MSSIPFIEIIKPVIEISILWFVFYRILLFFQGTRAFQVLKGIAYLILLFCCRRSLIFRFLIGF